LKERDLLKKLSSEKNYSGLSDMSGQEKYSESLLLSSVIIMVTNAAEWHSQDASHWSKRSD